MKKQLLVVFAGLSFGSMLVAGPVFEKAIKKSSVETASNYQGRLEALLTLLTFSAMREVMDLLTFQESTENGAAAWFINFGLYTMPVITSMEKVFVAEYSYLDTVRSEVMNDIRAQVKMPKAPSISIQMEYITNFLAALDKNYYSRVRALITDKNKAFFREGITGLITKL